MLEGALVRDVTDQGNADFENMGRPDWYIGENVYEVFSRLGAGGKLDFLEPIDDVFAGKTAQDTREDTISKRRFFPPMPTWLLLTWSQEDRSYRFEFIPLWGKTGIERSRSYIEGVIGVAMDVTGQRQQEAALEEESKEKRQAIANETAAREAN
ncbi:hypothetical protein IMZ48_36670, partial [Candidatus Bathyarchaeota archaeon]|nr:hypothetical protein [Candidatus Bathyarchaeota archaeon]